uniref:Uncharacterized protein n=1 Tax=Populus trichocarpa TaxID=3694 RepID=B9GFY1_POPTR
MRLEVKLRKTVRRCSRLKIRPTVHGEDGIGGMKESFQCCFNRDWKNILLSCCCSRRRDSATVLLLLIAIHRCYDAEAEAPEDCGAGIVEDTVLVRTKLARCRAVTVKEVTSGDDVVTNGGLLKGGRGNWLILGGRRRGDG